MEFVKFEDINVDALVQNVFSYNEFNKSLFDFCPDYLEKENINDALINIFTLNDSYEIQLNRPFEEKTISTKFDENNKKHLKQLDKVVSIVHAEIIKDNPNI